MFKFCASAGKRPDTSKPSEAFLGLIGISLWCFIANVVKEGRKHRLLEVTHAWAIKLRHTCRTVSALYSNNWCQNVAMVSKCLVILFHHGIIWQDRPIVFAKRSLN